MSTWRFFACFLVLVLGTGSAWGIPVLQIYVEGATYDTGTESWVLSDPGGTVRLWTIGNTDGPGSHGDISNVRLAIAYTSNNGPVNINLTPTTTGGYGGFTDPSTPSAPTYIQTVTDGSAPVLTDGGDLPNHGIYSMAGVMWQEFSLGDFTLEDSPVADFIDDFPTSGIRADSAQINVYEVSVTGADWFHFDLYDSVQSPNRAVFAPFSHDGETGDGPPVPEPGTIALVGLGLLSVVAARRVRRHS